MSGKYFVKCHECGQNAIGPYENWQEIFVRAYVLCPECLTMVDDDAAEEFFSQTGRRRRKLLDEQLNQPPVGEGES